MSCDNNVCGTGGWTGPQPGDPDNNVTLHANQVYGGINVSWTYPLTNSNAVAYTKLYRGVTASFSGAILQGQIGSSIYYDSLNPATDTTYYYWIQIVSVHGTIGGTIGPASAIARPLVKQTLESLTGQIDASQLAQDLKTSISGITANNIAIQNEILARLNANAGFAAALADVQSGVTQAMTYITNETSQRIDGINAQATQVSIVSAANRNALSAIDDEKLVRVGADNALSQRINSMLVTVGANTTAIQTEETARTTAVSAQAQRITDLTTTVTNNQTVALAAVHDEATARSTVTDALASRILTTETVLNGNSATAQLGLITKVALNSGTVQAISAEMFAKVEVNGLIGGFGLYNEGTRVDAGFDVDRFWVGRTGPDKVKPFIIDNGTVYINKAQIRSADIDTLKIAGNSVMVGVYNEAGQATVPASGETTLITRSINLGDTNNSGLIISGTVAVNATDNCTVGFQIRINGTVVGDQRGSIQGGYGYIFPVSGFGYPSNPIVTVELVAYSPTNYVGANKTFTVGASTLSIMGGKR